MCVCVCSMCVLCVRVCVCEVASTLVHMYGTMKANPSGCWVTDAVNHLDDYYRTTYYKSPELINTL